MKHHAQWITVPANTERTVVTFRRDLTLTKQIKRAVAHMTSLGVYHFTINGKKVGKAVLAPGWTSYHNRIQYQTYDITAHASAQMRIEVGVGTGWAMSNLVWENKNKYYADAPALFAWLEFTYEDGETVCICSDDTWQVYTSEVLSSEIYHGETVDKTAPITLLGNAVPMEYSAKLIPQVGEWICEHEQLAPIEVIRTPKGELVLDFGQNLAGYVRIRAKGKRGDRIVVHHAEVLDRDGNFYTDNLRIARNENIYILSGGEDVFAPTYTFQGFRYIHLVEYPFDTVDPENFRAVAVYSDLKRTGRFACGNEKINQLYHNVVWGQRSNYLDVPTDCPQRDERLGWTGDAQVFCRTAAINFDVEKFFIKWLGDVMAEQREDGSIPDFVPVLNSDNHSAAWGDVCCVAPYQIYLAYGNKKALRKWFPMMKKWVDCIHRSGPEEFLWLEKWHYGDWLALDSGDPDTLFGMTPTDFIASAFYAYSTSLLIACGKAIGKDVSQYEALYPKVRAAFRARYLKDGKLFLRPNEWKEGEEIQFPETQTAYVLLLFFDLLENEEKPYFAKCLVDLIRKADNHLTTGFVGTPYLLHVLSQNGYADVAYDLLLQESSPSWLYSVNHGATTMWEHWNSQKEDGSFWSTTMNSFNHYAFGAVYDWIFGVAVGIQPVFSAPAYKEITLTPHPHRALGFARASIDSRNGFILSHWYYKGDMVYYEFEIPEGVTAHLQLPSGYTETLTGGIYHFSEPEN